MDVLIRSGSEGRLRLYRLDSGFFGVYLYERGDVPEPLDEKCLLHNKRAREDDAEVIFNKVLNLLR